jgi:ribosome recycling factor
MMQNEILQESKNRMQRCVDALEQDLAKLRTGRAHHSLLDHLMVSAYGVETPLNQVASIVVEDARTLTVQPWDKQLVAAIEKAIIKSDLGLNPATAGLNIRIPMPPLTAERRKDLIRVVKAEGENSKIAVRSIRRDANNRLKELLKSKTLSEDDERRAQDAIQKLTDQFVSAIDKLLTAKESDLLEL